MKWLGQYIQSFTARFRDDVYLENLTTTTETDIIVVGSDGLLSKRASSGLTSGLVTVTDSSADTAFPIVFHNESNGLLDNTGTFTYNPADDKLNVDSIVTSTLSSASGAGVVTIDSAEGIQITNSASAKPVLTLKTTHTDKDQSSELQFKKDAADTEDGENIGKITWYGEDEGNNNTQFAEILAEIAESDDGAEEGKISISVASHDGELKPGLQVESGTAEDVVDVTLGNTTYSTTTVKGDLDIRDVVSTNDYHYVAFENRMSADGHKSAKILKYSPGSSTSLNGSEIYYLGTGGVWAQADADAVSTGASQMLGVGLGGDPQTVGVLIEGFVRIASTEILNTPGSGAVDGLPLYVSTTAGHFDFTAPTGSGDFVRIVGYAIDDDSGDVLVYFDPDKTWVEIA
mgnify:CR=1 FL=1|tara:strand:- start:998 stop:2203 length:1206 start_codon:yes stop_codon:yes gene_type:complete